MTRALELDRDRILAYRRAANSLDERLPPGPASLRRAAWAGLQDSMPRAALLSIHARVAATGPTTWEDPSLTQVWGPRFNAYVVAEEDVAPFTLGRLPDDESGRRRADDAATRLEAFLDGRRMPYGDAGRAMGVHPNSLRYGAPTGRIRLRWDGARQPTIWTVPAPSVDPVGARLELARRFVHLFGPTVPGSFSRWAGISAAAAAAAFEALAMSLAAVRSPISEGWIMADDEAAFRAPPSRHGGARLLPSGDAYWLLWGADRELLVPDPLQRAALWTPRVWPGGVLVGGELAGTWQRADASVSIQPWRRFSTAERDAVHAEAESLPLPGTQAAIRVSWAD